MTQPVQEPNTQRFESQVGWGQSQLFRRPAPAAGSSSAVPVEWIEFQSTTNWGSSVGTVLSFTFVNGNYDSTTPTFDVVAGVPKIYRSGAYEFRIIVRNVTASTAGVQSTVRVDLTRTAGAIPTIINYSPDQQLVDVVGPSSTDLLTPWWTGLILYSGSAGGLFGTPTSLQVAATDYQNGTITANSSPVVVLTLVRLGDAYS